MSTVAGPLHVSSILRTMAIAPPSRDRHHAARQLAGLDPKQFLSNLQLAVANRSPHAIAALKADMHQLDDVFYKLSRAGHDVSAAQRDFQMLQAFVYQIASPHAAAAPEKQRSSHHRTSSVPSSSSPPSQSALHSRPHSSSVKVDYHASTREAPNGSSRSTPGSSPSSTSSSSSSSSRHVNSTVLSPVPHRLTKRRRASAPTVPAPSMKKVHFATHATVYTFAPQAGGSHAVLPPPRPACVPRVSGSVSGDTRPRF